MKELLKRLQEGSALQLKQDGSSYKVLDNSRGAETLLIEYPDGKVDVLSYEDAEENFNIPIEIAWF